MRLVTFDAGEGPRLGAVVDTSILDLARLGESDGGASLPSDMLGFIRSGDDAWNRARSLLAGAVGGRVAANASHESSGVKLLAPIPRPDKNVFCLGVNYREHLEEANRAANRDLQPEVPVYFTKAVTTIVAPGGPILFDESVTTKYDWEAEMGVVIGRGGKGISRERAMEHVFGYTCFNDVTGRDVQRAHVQWFLGKSLDGTCPFGPWIITADEVPDPHNLHVELRVNGVVKQSANTSMLINDIPACIYYLSRGLTLEAGDLISTGTPSGVGYARTPPEFLKPGDIVEVDIEGIGVLRNPVVDVREL
ncbi:MAG: 5-oxopent-3-ene-1,2,5-tricarboxylate decarboxylase [Chloroflexi bacterium]|nr:5-oxopent-3-ene-1,2,5-tricarboxylate decarboxylase [Chloroflexota bacterium]